MAYFKSLIKVGHWGFGADKYNRFYVQADNILHAMYKIQQQPTAHHEEIPKSIEKVSEEEFVINYCINPYEKHYKNEIITKSSKDIKKHVFPLLRRERILNKTIETGEITKTLLGLVNACDSATSKSEREICENVLKNFIIYNYEHQDEVLGKVENLEEKAM